jgi:hypothetical protein
MSAQTDLAREAVDHLSALITIAPQLSGELAFADADSLGAVRLRLIEGIAEVEAADAGKPSPRSVRLQAASDLRDRETAARLERETKWAREHNWEVGVPPVGKR